MPWLCETANTLQFVEEIAGERHILIEFTDLHRVRDLGARLAEHIRKLDTEIDELATSFNAEDGKWRGWLEQARDRLQDRLDRERRGDSSPFSRRRPRARRT